MHQNDSSGGGGGDSVGATAIVNEAGDDMPPPGVAEGIDNPLYVSELLCYIQFHMKRTTRDHIGEVIKRF